MREHRIAATRLSAAGVGALAAIVTTDTAEGQASTGEWRWSNGWSDPAGAHAAP